MRPVGVGETWWHLFAKILLKVTGPETTIAFQLCAGLKAAIDGAVHRVQAIWYGNSTTDDWGFLLVDENNVFRNIHRVGMLWTVRHLWPSGDRFVFNCYRRWSLIFLQNRNGTSSFMLSNEGVTQGVLSQ